MDTTPPHNPDAMGPGQSRDPRRELALETVRRAALLFFSRERVNPPDAEELANDSVMVVWKRFESGSPIEDPGAYGHVVAKNMLMNYNRREQTQRRREASEVDLDRLPTPENTDERGPLWEALRTCLAALPAGERVLLERYYSEDREDLARGLNKKSGALQTQVCRIRQKVRDCGTEKLSAGATS